MTETDELTRLRGENGRLTNQVRCAEIELEQKEEKIQLLMRDCVGAPDERFEEKEMRIAELEEQIEALENKNFRMQQENTTLTTTARNTAFPKQGAGAASG